MRPAVGRDHPAVLPSLLAPSTCCLPPGSASPISTEQTPHSTETCTYRKVNLEVVVSTRPLPQVLSTRCHLPSRYTAFQAWSNSPEKLCPVW